MAVRTQRLTPLSQAKARRGTLPRYLHLDISRSLLIAVVLLCLMSLIALGQTGVVATKGYAIVNLETQKTELLRERSQLQLSYAEAQELQRIHARAAEIGLRPATSDQMRYMSIAEDALTQPIIIDEAVEGPADPVAVPPEATEGQAVLPEAVEGQPDVAPQPDEADRAIDGQPGVMEDD